MPFTINLRIEGETGFATNDMFGVPFAVGAIERVSVTVPDGQTEEIDLLAAPLPTVRLLALGADTYDGLAFGVNNGAVDAPLAGPQMLTGLLAYRAGADPVSRIAVRNESGGERTIYVLVCRDP